MLTQRCCSGNASRMEFGANSAVAAWRRLAGATDVSANDAQLHVVVNPESGVAPRGWAGIIAIGDVVTATVPVTEFYEPFAVALDAITSEDLVTPAALIERLPPVSATLGPAYLFYPPAGYAVPTTAGEEAHRQQIDGLIAAAAPEDLDESGIAHIESAAFVSRADDGNIVSACGYRRWPNGVAHISALTHPDHRGRGHGFRAASAAVAAAIAEELLPQWRARPIESRRLALALGLDVLGAQLSLQLEDGTKD